MQPLRRPLACVARAALVVLAALAPLAAAAQAWPQRPLRIIVPYPPGGPSDIVLRAAAARMQAALNGQPILIENRPGAGGNVGVSEAARAEPDGYTWVWVTDSIFTVNPFVYRSLGFRPDDLVPVTIASEFSQTLVCNPATGIRSVKEMLAKARTTPLSYASGGYGVPGHLAMELLLADSGVKMQHVPYKGPAPAMQDVIGGQVPMVFISVANAEPAAKAGQVKILAVLEPERFAKMPDVPSMSEIIPAFRKPSSWFGFFGPPGLPQPIVDRLNAEMMKALKSPDIEQSFATNGYAVIGGTPQQFADLPKDGLHRYGAIIKAAGIQPE